MNEFENRNTRILNFTHIDLDGVTAGIVIANYFKEVDTQQINYGKEQEAYDYIIAHRNDFDAIIFTDFTPVNIQNIQKLNIPVLVLDHHESAKQFNDPEHGIFINTKYCGAMLAYKFFNQHGEISHLEDLVKIANDYDMWILNDPRSRPFNILMWEMGFKWFFRRFLKGNTALYGEEYDYLTFYKKDYEKIWDNLEVSDLPHNGVFFTATKYLSDIYADLSKTYDYIICKNNFSLSLRSRTDDINLVNVCNRVGKGGGHKAAAGIPIGNDNIATLVQKICFEVEHELNYGKELPF